MEIFLIDAIGPFFRGYGRKRINWSKVPFLHLADAGPEDWTAIEQEMRILAGRITSQGYNSVSLDDVAHLAPHPMHEPEVADRISMLRVRFTRIFDMLRGEFGLRIFLTSDVLPVTPALSSAFGNDRNGLDNYYHNMVLGILDDFPQLGGLILRIGESDGKDVRDPIRTRLHLRDAASTNRLLRTLLPEFESRGRELIFRTWTVGAHRIGDLIWHRDTLENTLEGLDSPNLIVSMKHGESDFFRYLPLNRSFFRVKQRKLLELQARREYEGAGEYPSFIGRDCERFARDLRHVDNMAGISVWCQTGGWHRFRRRAFLENDGSDIWIRLNTAAAITVFKHGKPADSAVEDTLGIERTPAALELLDHADTVIRLILYIHEFARQKLFFRRVRVPPLLHVYWDSLFVNHGVRKLMRHFVKNPERGLADAEAAVELFPRMTCMARDADLPADDIEHMREFFQLILLARRFYFLPFDETLAVRIRSAKEAYKQRWPAGIRQRYRIRVSFEPFPLKRRTLAIVAKLLLRRKRGYRLLDRMIILPLSGIAFRLLRPRDPATMPKFLRKSAMGVETLFK